MGLGKNQSNGNPRREGRGWGPFTGGQLTIVIVAIAAMFAIPTVALAAGGTFTTNSATLPAVKATNSNANGIGIQGTGKRYGVFSNGNLGVAAGKELRCTGCVTDTDVAINATRTPRSGEELMGAFGASDVYPAATPGHLTTIINFAQPMGDRQLPIVEVVPEGAGPAASAHCPSSAVTGAPGYLCVYVTPVDAVLESSHPIFKTLTGSHFSIFGFVLTWTEHGGGEASAVGRYRYLVR
jgi:hypothetical protein